MTVAGEAADWPSAVREVIAQRPAIALMDVRMPGMDAADGVAAIRREVPATGIVLFSAFDREEEVYSVLRAGAQGFLLKECTREELRECLHAVCEGKTWLAPGPAAKLAARVRTPELTAREAEIIQFVAEGKSNKEVGALLRITEGTVKVHLNHIFGKLGVNGRTAAIARALQRGLVKMTKVT